MMSKKVMIADDDAAIVDFLSILLQLEGYDITSTLNGATLLEMDDDLPDLIILDIWMSGVDGRDVCKQLKQQEHTRNIPILMVSASTNIQDSAMSAGANDFLSKPFDMDELLKKVEKNLLNTN